MEQRRRRRPGTAEPTRRRVEEAIETLGFVRNSAARTLVSGRSSSIGVVLTDLGNSLFIDIARGAEAAAAFAYAAELEPNQALRALYLARAERAMN